MSEKNKQENDTLLIYNRIKFHYGLKTNTELSKFLGITPAAITNSIDRNSINWENIFTKCKNINLNWLVYGEGEMFQNSDDILPKSYEKTLEKLTNYIELLERENEKLKEESKTK